MRAHCRTLCCRWVDPPGVLLQDVLCCLTPPSHAAGAPGTAGECQRCCRSVCQGWAAPFHPQLQELLWELTSARPNKRQRKRACKDRDSMDRASTALSKSSKQAEASRQHLYQQDLAFPNHHPHTAKADGGRCAAGSAEPCEQPSRVPGGSPCSRGAVRKGAEHCAA